MPETLSSNILRRRAQRLRKESDKPQQAQLALESAVPTLNFLLGIVYQIVDDLTLSCTDPVILFVNIHTMLIYGILYLWFEFFPFGEPYQQPPLNTTSSVADRDLTKHS
jgi:DHA1 family multidrug resistance protein-like MFS transporter